MACGELEQEQGWFFKMLEQQSFQFSAEIVELGAGLWKCHVPQLAQSSPGVRAVERHQVTQEPLPLDYAFKMLETVSWRQKTSYFS